MNLKKQTQTALATMVAAGALMTEPAQAAFVDVGIDFAQNSIDAGETVNLGINAFSGTLGSSEIFTVQVSGFQPGWEVDATVGSYNEATGVWSYSTSQSGLFTTGLSVTAPEGWTGGDLTVTGQASSFDFVTGQTNAVIDTEILSVNSPSAVPVPAAAWLFGSALLGMAGIARRRGGFNENAGKTEQEQVQRPAPKASQVLAV